MSVLAQVCLPNSKRNYYTYQTDRPIQAGCRVWVPFAHKTRLGIVISMTHQTDVPLEKLKPILEILDTEPLLSAEILKLCVWISDYYQYPLSEVLPAALPKYFREGGHMSLPSQTVFTLAMPETAARTLLPKQAKKATALLDHLCQISNLHPPLTFDTIKSLGFKKQHIDYLLEKNIVNTRQERRLPASNLATESALTLNTQQAHALSAILAHLHAYHCFLLYGVTGSGKTEVYLQVIAEVLAKQQQVLVLVPEIGLTPQLLSRFEKRFNTAIVTIHSGLNEKARQTAWTLAHTGQAQLIIGTRSAIFTSLPNLGLIILDEEHDASFKQIEGVKYSARDTALWRASRLNIPIILGSATPSLESLHNCQQKKYTLLKLDHRAQAAAPLLITLADLRNVTLRHGLCEQTLKKIETHLKQNNQVLVFLNRRGFSPVLLCHQCGWIADCAACDSHLTVHRQLNQLICHHCGRMYCMKLQCQQCHSPELLPIGVGTQRLQEFLQAYFPSVKTVRMDRDAVSGQQKLSDQLSHIHQGEAQLIIGTQMMAKGHHFPNLTLVVVVDADNGFYNQDFRALERLGQLLVQVSGRAGRAERPGEVIIQTHLPQHPMLACLMQKGYEAFAQALLEDRYAAQLPPAHFMAIIRAEDKNPIHVQTFMEQIKTFLASITNHIPFTLHGPAPAPLARKAHYHRMQLLSKSPSRQNLQLALTRLREWITIKGYGKKVRWHIDVDPVDLS